MKTQKKTRIVFVLCFATLLLTLTASRAFADQVIGFHVQNAGGSPLTGASIWLQGSEGGLNDIPYGGITDQNGNANFDIPTGISIIYFAVQESGYVTVNGSSVNPSNTITMNPTGSSNPLPSSGPNPENPGPGIGSGGFGIQWNINSKDVEMWIVFLIVVVIVALLIGHKKGKKKER
jgi:hypothetical protein